MAEDNDKTGEASSPERKSDAQMAREYEAAREDQGTIPLPKIQDVFNTRIAPLMHLPGIPAETVLADSQEGTLQVSYSVNQETAAPSGLQAASTAKTADMSEPVAAGGANYLYMVAAHFVHNYIAAILPMPDTLSRNSISVLAERDYWADSRIWDGKLSSGLLRFIVLNLVLISLGAAYSWKKQGWRGLIPLAVFLVYDLAVSVSLTSGGRYIVPINWIVFFYYAMGLVLLEEKEKPFVSSLAAYI